MRICAVMKYPPIQGGVSAQCYWLARGLAAAGHQVHVVTNAGEVEDDYRILLDDDDRDWLTPSFDSGGFVTLRLTEPLSQRFKHVPQSNPFVSKLAGMAAEVIREHDCEVIFSYYLEPYGMAAHLASAWTGVPQVVHHAGSDHGRLFNRPDLATTYREIYRRAAGVCAARPLPFIGLGVEPRAIYKSPPFYLPRACFHAGAEPLDLNDHVAAMQRRRPDLVRSPGALDPELPTIGIYGKMGKPKGSFDLLAALGKLRGEGLGFNFVALTRGSNMDAYLDAIEDHGLGECAWVLPFVPHWKVARFIRACDAVCFLERDFPIKFHTPTIPKEILACGTCLVLSGEIAAKQAFEADIRDGDNVLVVPDPKVHDDLARALRRVIEDPARAAEVGRRGAALVAGSEDHAAVVAEYETLFADVIRCHKGQPSQVPAGDRGIPQSRAARIRMQIPVLVKALPDTIDDLLAEFCADSPAGAGDVMAPPAEWLDDAAAFCDWVASSAPGDDPRQKDLARFAREVIEMGRITAEDERRPLFARGDVLVERGKIDATAGKLARLAPLRTRWAWIRRFRYLPRELPDFRDAPREPGDYAVIFHKHPNMMGRCFYVNDLTAGLLERMDGTRTTEELIGLYRDRAPADADVPGVVLAAIRRFYREGLIVLTPPETGSGRA